MHPIQPGILAQVPPHARHLFFSLIPGADATVPVAGLGQIADGDATVVGLGSTVVEAMGKHVEGLRAFPAIGGSGLEIPATPAALWCWLRGEDRGELLHRTRRIEKTVAPALRLESAIDAFRYRAGDDLTGFEDGTENPVGGAAVEAATVKGEGPGRDGSSFVAVQQWVHDLDRFEAKSPQEQDNTFGRRKSDNEELPDAPPSAHIKRTAQEDFDPEAFVLRRSMPWVEAARAGLIFVAFGKSFDAFEALLRRMVGKDDGIQDALFTFTRPVSGSYFWCPPVLDGRLDVRALGLNAVGD